MSYRLTCANGNKCVDVRRDGYPTPARVAHTTAAGAVEFALWRGWRFRLDSTAICDECAAAEQGEYLTAEELWACIVCGAPADQDGNHDCSCIPF